MKKETLDNLRSLFVCVRLTKQLQYSLWLLIGLPCLNVFRTLCRLHLHPQLYLLGAGRFGSALASPTDFITIAFRLRWYVLVVEPSPPFRDRSLAAGCPLLHPSFFQAVTPAVSSYVVARKALGVPSNSPSDPLSRFQLRRPSNQITEAVATPLAEFD
jgi:hypothetical protein